MSRRTKCEMAAKMTKAAPKMKSALTLTSLFS